MDTKEIINCYVTSHVDSIDECKKIASERRLKVSAQFETNLGESYKQLELTGSIGDVCRFFYSLGNRKLYVFPS